MGVRGDFLVIGSGIAGLRAAISLADAGEVVVLTKTDPRESNTGYAQGGIAAAIGPDDSPELHGRDTLAAGDGLCTVEAVGRPGPRGGRADVRQLIDWGAAFDRDPDGAPALTREGSHSVRRVLHAHDATGRELGRVLWSRVAANRRIRVLDEALATELVIRDGLCVGVTYISKGRRAHGQRRTDAAGDRWRRPGLSRDDQPGDRHGRRGRHGGAGGRAGHGPRVRAVPSHRVEHRGIPRFLLSEALRGEGARLVNEHGEAFMSRYKRR